MAPSDLKHLVGQLALTLQRCDALCSDVLKYRRVGTKHEALDNLQLSLRASARALPADFTSLRKVYGSRFEHGDAAATAAVADAADAVHDLEDRLTAIARRENNGPPGFKDMLRRLHGAEDLVHDALNALGARLDAPPSPTYPHTTRPAAAAPSSAASDDRYLAHLRTCWAEQRVDGRSYYVNAVDATLDTWDYPTGGFVKHLPPLKSAMKKRPAADEHVPYVRPHIETPAYRRPTTASVPTPTTPTTRKASSSSPPPSANYRRPTVEDDYNPGY